MYLDDMAQVIDNSAETLEDGGVMAWQIGRGAKARKDHIGHLSVLMAERQLHYQDAIAWIKPSGNYSVKRSCHILANGFYYPAFRWEVILVYRKPGPMPRMSAVDRKYMAKHHVDVWEIPWVTHQMRRYGRPSVAPLEISLRCIRAYSRPENNVFEPFGGSGTTLIAAEKTKRNCLAIERRPEYCRIIIKRWGQLTGKKARRL
jgi:DNA modification methylase